MRSPGRRSGAPRDQSRCGCAMNDAPRRLRSMTDPLGLEFVLAGTRTAADVASELCAFLAPATRSIDVAIYDFDARSGASAAVGDALEAAAARGVQVRVAFNTQRLRRGAGAPPRGGRRAGARARPRR